MVAFDSEDEEPEPEQLPFEDPTFAERDAGWCPHCKSRDRLKPGCIFRGHGGDSEAFRRICRCSSGGHCYLHGKDPLAGR